MKLLKGVREAAIAVMIAAGGFGGVVHAERMSFPYEKFDRLTRRYVNQQGRVDYVGLKQELPALRSFVDRLAATGPENHPELFRDNGDRLRYYMTAYNAWVLYYAVRAYPKKHALWSRSGVFRNHPIKLDGRELSLNDLEHQIIRKRFRDPRVHFYVNCAAASCPPLQRGVIPPGRTSEELDRAARRFINDPANVRFDEAKKQLSLSPIFNWFSEDFLNYLRDKRGISDPHVAQYVLLYLDGPPCGALARTPLKQISIQYFDYDKSLNEQR